MPRFHPVRVLRRSGWKSRAALAVVLAGFIAGPLGAHPADAHGNGIHQVIVQGTMILDDPVHNKHCETFKSQQATYSRTSPKANIDIVTQPCGEVIGFLRVNTSWRSDTMANGDGFARTTIHHCTAWVICNDTSTEKAFSNVAWWERTTGQRLTTTVGFTNGVKVAFDFEVIIIG